MLGHTIKRMKALHLKFKGLFDRLNLREQILLSSILVILSLWWLLEFFTGVGSSIDRANITSLSLENQQLWLDQESQYDERMAIVLSKMDSTKTYSGNQLLEVMDEIARDVGLDTSISRPVTRNGEIFTEYVLLIPISRASMRTMIDFENQIKTHYPYLGIDYLLLEPQPSSADLLRGEMRVTSFELNPS